MGFQVSRCDWVSEVLGVTTLQKETSKPGKKLRFPRFPSFSLTSCFLSSFDDFPIRSPLLLSPWEVCGLFLLPCCIRWSIWTYYHHRFLCFWQKFKKGLFALRVRIKGWSSGSRSCLTRKHRYRRHISWDLTPRGNLLLDFSSILLPLYLFFRASCSPSLPKRLHPLRSTLTF